MKQKLFQKPTLVTVLGGITLIIGIPFCIYGLSLKEGGSLLGALIFYGLLVVTIIILLDRLLAKIINLKLLNIVESVLLVIGITYFLFTQRKIIIDLRTQDVDYFVLVENNGTLKNAELKPVFPFDKKMNISDNIAVINSIKDNYQRIEVKSPSGWKGQRWQPWKLEELRMRFYSNADLELSGPEIDSLLSLKDLTKQFAQ